MHSGSAPWSVPKTTKKRDRGFWPRFKCYELPTEQSRQGLFPRQSIHWYSFYMHSYNSDHLQASSVFSINPCLVPTLTTLWSWPSPSYWRSGRKIQQPAILQAPMPSLPKTSYFLLSTSCSPLLFFFSVFFLHPPLLSPRETDPQISLPKNQKNPKLSLLLPSQAPFQELPMHRYCPPPENHKPRRSFWKLTPGLTLKPSKMKLEFTLQQWSTITCLVTPCSVTYVLSHIVFFSNFFTCLLFNCSFDIFFCFHNEKATQKIEFFPHAEEPRSSLDVVFQPQPQDGALTMVHSHFTCNWEFMPTLNYFFIIHVLAFWGS